MPTFKLTQSAQDDIHDLVVYTIDTWGKAQSEKYYAGLTKQAMLLAEMPTLGKSAENYKKADVRVFPYEKHLMYYIEAPHGITILNVIHTNKDQERHISHSGNA